MLEKTTSSNKDIWSDDIFQVEFQGKEFDVWYIVDKDSQGNIEGRFSFDANDDDVYEYYHELCDLLKEEIKNRFPDSDIRIGDGTSPYYILLHEEPSYPSLADKLAEALGWEVIVA